jgi:hypothetical protein
MIDINRDALVEARYPQAVIKALSRPLPLDISTLRPLVASLLNLTADAHGMSSWNLLTTEGSTVCLSQHIPLLIRQAGIVYPLEGGVTVAGWLWTVALSVSKNGTSGQALLISGKTVDVELLLEPLMRALKVEITTEDVVIIAAACEMISDRSEGSVQPLASFEGSHAVLDFIQYAGPWPQLDSDDTNTLGKAKASLVNALVLDIPVIDAEWFWSRMESWMASGRDDLICCGLLCFGNILSDSK